MNYRYNLCQDCLRRDNGCQIDPTEPVLECIEFRFDEHKMPSRGLNNGDSIDLGDDEISWSIWMRRYLRAYTYSRCALKALKDGRITHAMNFLKDI